MPEKGKKTQVCRLAGLTLKHSFFVNTYIKSSRFNLPVGTFDLHHFLNTDKRVMPPVETCNSRCLH